MKDNIEMLLKEIKKNTNPSIVALKLSVFISDSLRDKQISIYEAYLLNAEVINNTRDSYLLPAWNRRVRISTCIMILNQRLLALAFKDNDYAQKLNEWGLEAEKLCADKRNHYIMDHYKAFLEMRETSLQELLDKRKQYDSLHDEQGPYHVEVFPYGYCVPEELLLEDRDLCDEKENIGEEIKELLIALSI